MIIVDVETTGVNPQKHSIVSIGALDFLNPQNTFYEECRVWDGAEIDEGALKVNGFTKEQIADPKKQTPEEAVKKFIAWTKDMPNRTIAGGNPFFDADFLKASARRDKISWDFARRIIDLHTLAYAHLLRRGIVPPVQNRKTDITVDWTLAYVGLPEEPKPHIGIVGAKMEAEAFSRLIYGKSLLDEYKSFPIPAYLL